MRYIISVVPCNKWFGSGGEAISDVVFRCFTSVEGLSKQAHPVGKSPDVPYQQMLKDSICWGIPTSYSKRVVCVCNSMGFHAQD